MDSREGRHGAIPRDPGPRVAGGDGLVRRLMPERRVGVALEAPRAPEADRRTQT